MSQLKQELDPQFWDDQDWTNFCNDISNNENPFQLIEEGKDEAQIELVGNGKAKVKEENEETNDSEKTSDIQVHILLERERRKKMNNMFSYLQDFLPQLPNVKVDKATIIEQAIKYIRTLESTVENLEKQKQERIQVATPPSNHTYGERIQVATPPSNHTYGRRPFVATPSRLAPAVTRESYMADNVSKMDDSYSVESACLLEYPNGIMTWSSPNVVLNVCGNKAQISVYLAKKRGILTGICSVLQKHKLEVVTANVTSDNDRFVYMFHARVTNDALAQGKRADEIFKDATDEILNLINNS